MTATAGTKLALEIAVGDVVDYKSSFGTARARVTQAPRRVTSGRAVEIVIVVRRITDDTLVTLRFNERQRVAVSS